MIWIIAIGLSLLYWWAFYGRPPKHTELELFLIQRQQENLAGIHGRGAQDYARSRQAK